jgi:hypothetical protein
MQTSFREKNCTQRNGAHFAEWRDLPRSAAMRNACLLLALVAAGCGGIAAPASDPCDAAMAHVNACGGTALATPATCDAELARTLLSLDCTQLAAAARAQADRRGAESFGPFDDVMSSIACAAGIIRACPQPACTDQPAPAATCAGYIADAGCGGCQFYTCREAEKTGGCGPRGYYLGFADKYCVRFLQSLRPRMSPAGQRFLDAGRDCLMRYVDAQLPAQLACDTVKAEALASHVACYRDNGFCALPLSDKWMLLNTVDPADVDLTAALKTGLSCF